MRLDNINGSGMGIIKDAYQRAQAEAKGDFEKILEEAQKEKDREKLKETCRELEAVFVNIVFERMRATVPRDGLIKESLGEDIFRSLLDEELSRRVSRGEGLGISGLLYDQLVKKLDE